MLLFKQDKKFFQAVAVMIGYIIGVGIFSLPFLTYKSGVITFIIMLLGFGAVQYIIHMIYASLIVATKNFHRLPGYTEIYLGKKWKLAVFAADMFGNGGCLLAYTIITGIFLNELLGPILGGSAFMYASVTLGIEAIIVFLGINMIAQCELYMSALLVLIVGLITWKGQGTISFQNYSAVDWKYIFLPFGALMTALDGNGSLPVVGKLVEKNIVKFKSVIRTSMFVVLAVTLVFPLVVVGITGAGTTQDSLAGIKAMVGGGIPILALIFGFFCIVTSVLGVSESVKETLWWDFKINKNLAWAITFLVPYSLYFFGVRSLTTVVSLIGAIGTGFCAITMLLVFRKLKKITNHPMLFKRPPSNVLIFCLIALFFAGMIYEVSHFVFGVF
jgi:amino acid permease